MSVTQLISSMASVIALPRSHNNVLINLNLATLSLVAIVGCSSSNTPSKDIKTTASTTTNSPASSVAKIASEPASTTTASVASATVATPNQITLYTSIDKSALEPLLLTYSKKVNIPIHIVEDEPTSILARLKAEGANSPADVILTEDAGLFSVAVEEGLLQPFNSEKAIANVPPRYRDADGNWIALSSYARTAVYDSRVLKSFDISSYADLAKPKWSQKLCLSQGRYTPNQSLMVNLINNLGDKKAEAVMQGWLANLAIPIVLDDNEVLQAIENGKCQVGIVNSHRYASYLQAHPQTPVKLTWINKGYGGVHTNITAMAIPHSAKHPELALGLIEWLAAKDQQSLYASLSKTYPMDKDAEPNVLLKSWGELEASPIPVRQYGEKQKMTIELMKEAGYY